VAVPKPEQIEFQREKNEARNADASTRLTKLDFQQNTTADTRAKEENVLTTMFRPTTVTSHKVRLQFSDASRDATPAIRTNHGSLPSFHDNVDDLAAAIIGDKKAKKANFEEKLAKIHELPKMRTPEALPGDCDVKSFVLENVTPYAGESSFLAPVTERTLKTWKRCEELMELERQRGILDVDTKTASTVTSHGPGYVLSKDEDVIKGLQTDEPLKRACKPRGGFSVVASALKSYGFEPDAAMAKTYTQVRYFRSFASFDARSRKLNDII
jgi:Pyruvate formate lyase-like